VFTGDQPGRRIVGASEDSPNDLAVTDWWRLFFNPRPNVTLRIRPRKKYMWSE
jgi:hypothetical protein